MKLAGHTMATPGMEIEKAIDIFRDIGLAGIEIAARQGEAFTVDADEEQVNRVMRYSAERDIKIITLTPYFWDINSKDDTIARENTEGLKKAVLLADRMGASFVRAYGGREKKQDEWEECWSRLVEALKEAGKLAAEKDISILVENHPGTMTVTGEATRKLLEEVNLPNVLALYDPANVLYHSAEDWQHTLEVQEEFIGYVHVKDYYIKDGSRIACNVGEGIVPWNKILRRMKNKDLWFSFEYEKKWHPEQLADAATGVKKCYDYIKLLI